MAVVTCESLGLLLGLPVLLIERGLLSREPYMYGARVTIQATPAQVTADHLAVMDETFAPDEVYVVTQP